MKAIAIPYIVAIIIGILVVGVIGYQFFGLVAKGSGTSFTINCDAKKVSFCQNPVLAVWDMNCGPQPDCKQLSSSATGKTSTDEQKSDTQNPADQSGASDADNANDEGTIVSLGLELKGCGEQCDKEPPLPLGVESIVFCSKPLTVTYDNLDDEYKNYQNVLNNPNKDDNRYFVYVTKNTRDHINVNIKNLKNVVLEKLLTGNSLDMSGSTLNIKDSTAFIVHGNPEKENPIWDACGWWCDDKNLELSSSSKIKFSGTDSCDTLVASNIYLPFAATESVAGESNSFISEFDVAKFQLLGVVGSTTQVALSQLDHSQAVEKTELTNLQKDLYDYYFNQEGTTTVLQDKNLLPVDKFLEKYPQYKGSMPDNLGSLFTYESADFIKLNPYTTSNFLYRGASNNQFLGYISNGGIRAHGMIIEGVSTSFDPGVSLQFATEKGVSDGVVIMLDRSLQTEIPFVVNPEGGYTYEEEIRFLKDIPTDKFEHVLMHPETRDNIYLQLIAKIDPELSNQIDNSKTNNNLQQYEILKQNAIEEAGNFKLPDGRKLNDLINIVNYDSVGKYATSSNVVDVGGAKSADPIKYADMRAKMLKEILKLSTGLDESNSYNELMIKVPSLSEAEIKFRETANLYGHVSSLEEGTPLGLTSTDNGINSQTLQTIIRDVDTYYIRALHDLDKKGMLSDDTVIDKAMDARQILYDLSTKETVGIDEFSNKINDVRGKISEVGDFINTKTRIEGTVHSRLLTKLWAIDISRVGPDFTKYYENINAYRRLAPADLKNDPILAGVPDQMENSMKEFEASYKENKINLKAANQLTDIDAKLLKKLKSLEPDQIGSLNRLLKIVNMEGMNQNPRFKEIMQKVLGDGILEKLKTATQNEITVLMNKYEKIHTDTLGAAKNSQLKGKVMSFQKMRDSLKTAAGIDAVGELGKSSGFTSSVFGTGFLLATSLGPEFEDYGNAMDNAVFISAGKAIHLTGIGAMTVTGGATLASATATTLTFGARTGLKQLVFSGASLAEGFGYGMIAQIAIDSAYCSYVNPKSEMCGCSVDPWYNTGGKPIMELQKYTVNKGETIEYRVYGMQHCNVYVVPISGKEVPQFSGDLYQKTQYGLISSDQPVSISSCSFESPNWCSGTWTVNLNPGKYQIRGIVDTISVEPKDIAKSDYDTLVVR